MTSYGGDSVGWRRLLVGAALIGVATLVGCGDDDGAGDDAASEATAGVSTPASDTAPTVTDVSTTGGGGATDDVVADAQARVEQLYEGFNESPPSDGPAAVADQKVWVISCGEINEACSDWAGGAIDAADALGWESHLFDANFDAVLAGDAITQAIADNATAILWVAFDCPDLQGPLEQARDAGIVLVGVYALDCDDPLLETPAEGLFVPYPQAGNVEHFGEAVRQYGRDRADVVIAATNGQVKLVTTPIVTNTADRTQYAAFKERLAECAGCEILAEVEITDEELASPAALEQKMSTALTQNPDAEGVWLSSDSMLLAGIQQAITTSGQELRVFGSEGYEANLDLIREGGGQESSLALDAHWMSWSAMDALNRALAGAQPAFGGHGWTLVDADHNLPESGPWDSKVDFRAAFKQVWGG